MHLDPTPLPLALAHLLESITRVSALVQPALGLAPPSQPHHHGREQGEHGQGDNDDGEVGHATATAHAAQDGVANPSSRQERGHKRVVRVRYDLNHARSLLEQLRGVFRGDQGNEDGNGGGGGRWDDIDRCRKGLVEMRQVAAVLGAGALVLYCLEGTLVELGRLYEVEEGIKKGGGDVPHAVDRREKGVKDRDVDVVRWMRHERRGEVWDLMKGVKDFGTAVWFLLTIFER